MSAYLWAVQIGMPEGMDGPAQQLWLHKWKLHEESKLAAAEARATAAEDGLYDAWVVIANAGEGDWENEDLAWQRSARRWHNKYADSVNEAMKRAAIAAVGGKDG